MSRSANQTRLWRADRVSRTVRTLPPQPCAGDLVTIKPVVDAQPQTRNLRDIAQHIVQRPLANEEIKVGLLKALRINRSASG